MRNIVTVVPAAAALLPTIGSISVGTVFRYKGSAEGNYYMKVDNGADPSAVSLVSGIIYTRLNQDAEIEPTTSVNIQRGR